MVDYSYYVGVYGGVAIKDATQFRRLSYEATVKVDYYTFDRATKATDESVAEKVRRTICKVADILAQNEEIGFISKTTIEGVSVDYNIELNIKNEIYRVILENLSSTGLTYAGVDRKCYFRR